MKKLLFISLIFATLFSSTTLLSQTSKVRVTVYLGQINSGIVIPGAVVQVKNSSIGSVTNEDGWADVTCAENATLLIYATGTNTLEEQRYARNAIKVALSVYEGCLFYKTISTNFTPLILLAANSHKENLYLKYI